MYKNDIDMVQILNDTQWIQFKTHVDKEKIVIFEFSITVLDLLQTRST